MLAGRVDIRHGLTVIVGCFILFGASSIVAGIQSALPREERAEAPFVPEPPPPAIPTLPPGSNDPYAGASVPAR